jgi:hypothetical protein
LVHRALPFHLPAIEIGMLWHLRDEADSGQRWFRDTVARAAAEVSRTAQRTGDVDAALPPGG